MSIQITISAEGETQEQVAVYLKLIAESLIHVKQQKLDGKAREVKMGDIRLGSVQVEADDDSARKHYGLPPLKVGKVGPAFEHGPSDGCFAPHNPDAFESKLSTQ